MDGRVMRASRRLVLELVIVGLLVGLPIDFPTDFATAGAPWIFLLGHPSFLLHAVVGTVVLVEAVVLVVRCVPRRVSSVIIAGVGLGCVLLAFGAGSVFVSTGGQGSSLMPMTLGWVGALAAYVVGWVLGRRAMVRHRTLLARRPGVIPSPGQVHQDQSVAERVGDDGHPADRDVERFDGHRSAGGPDGLGGSIDGGNQPVRLERLLRRENQLALGAGQPQARLADRVVPPDQRLPEPVAVEGQTRLEVRNRHRDCVDRVQDAGQGFRHGQCASLAVCGLLPSWRQSVSATSTS